MSAKRVTGHLTKRERQEGWVWFAKTRVPGRVPEETMRRLAPAHVGVGRPPEGRLSRKDAEVMLAGLLAEERGKVGQGSYDFRPEGATFADAAAEFLRYVADVRQREASTVADYRGVIDGYLLPRFGALPVDNIGPDVIEAYRDELLAAGRLSNRTIVRHLAVLHGVFKRAARKWGLESNPAAADLVDRPTVRYSGDFEALDREELEALARAAASEQDAAIYLTAAFTGLRLGELSALRWRDVDFALQRFQVRLNYTNGAEKAPKSGRVRSVPMMEELVPILDRLSQRDYFTGPDDLVFCNAIGEHLDAWALRRRFYAALEAAGLRRIRIHDLRHCFGSTAVKAFELSGVQAMMGHAHITTTMRYVHHRPGADDAAKLSQAFRPSVPPAVPPEPQALGDFEAGTDPDLETEST
jgi:integrase